MSNKQLLIVFHSQSSRSEQLAFAVRRGALLDDACKVRMLRALDANSTDVMNADAVIVVGAEHFANASGGIKQFFDRIFYPLERASVVAKPYTLIISAGNDGSHCERQIKTILQGLQWKMVQDTLFVYGAPTDDALHQANELGQAIAAGLSLGVY